jgi:hypothetical protein
MQWLFACVLGGLFLCHGQQPKGFAELNQEWIVA